MERMLGNFRKTTLAALLCATTLIVAPATPAWAQADELVVALSTFSEETMTPWGGSGQRKTYLDLAYEYLTYIDPETGEAVPGLAQSWDMSPDGRTWTFHLREGIEFAGGYGELTSEDVAYSIARLIGEDSRAGPASAMRRAIASVQTPDERTVVVNLNVPDFELAKGYFGSGQQLGIVSKAYFDELGADEAQARPIGTGPYVLENVTSGSEILMTLREDVGDHWRVNPEFETVSFRVVPEESTRVAMLQTGEADIAPIGFDSIPTVENAGLRIVSAQATWSPVVRFGGLIQTDPARYNPDTPWASREVRQALNYAVDKQTIIDELFQGEATIAASDTPVPAWSEVEPYPYDPDMARQLLAEAGYPDGFDITLKTFTTAPGAELPLMAEAVALYWQDIGVNTTIEPVDWPSIRTAWTQGQASDYVWTHRGFPFASAANGLEAGFMQDSLFASFTSPELEAMIQQFSSEEDAQTRSALFTEIGQYLRDEAAGVFIALANEPYGVSDKVGEWDISGAYGWNFDRATRAQ
ncbi:ABC transporter substrate-binding protein [Pelagibacterium flavum]|uniref:ABC transporter substrate-binding protein n=1 Tax=Pelagibacterium flavum TaxID=2984530 RepID=A0ABY6INW0_9HYPH|nr:ABC transporter substrate-binding protein [Pelagibacterium sp. YIM 151497]UYQ72074.1 ABC transporter substrate-binding protein [Pelagibacterium sp. YIM 151497]